MASLYKSTIFPLLTRFDAETTHNITLALLEFAQKHAIGRLVLRKIAGPITLQEGVELFGIKFPNRLGVAAGFDKDARVVPGLILLGFGHVEVGTITPNPQMGNPRPRIFRLTADRALINRMGFPSLGAEKVAVSLRRIRRECPDCVIGASLGRQKTRRLEESAKDYILVMDHIHQYVDYLAINISSPNTPDLRKLQYKSHLKGLLCAITEHNRHLSERANRKAVPILVKISPDLRSKELQHLLDVSLEIGVGGIIATNTTISRRGIASRFSDESGGLSGLPLAEKSTDIIRMASSYTNNGLPVVGVGGVFTAEDCMEKLAAGASLIQLYTGLIYEGPGIAGRILRNLRI